MIERYIKLREFLPELNSTIVDSLCLSPSENRRIDNLVVQLESLNSVTKELLKDATSMIDTRALFDLVIEDFPETDNLLAPRAPIVHDPFFESGIAKVEGNNQTAMSSEEKRVVRKVLLSEQEVTDDNDEICLSFAERLLKRRKKEDLGGFRIYKNTNYLLPTSNICDRIFSSAGYLLNDRRRALTLANLESQFFLHINQDLWSASDINRLILR